MVPYKQKFIKEKLKLQSDQTLELITSLKTCSHDPFLRIRFLLVNKKHEKYN